MFPLKTTFYRCKKKVQLFLALTLLSTDVEASFLNAIKFVFQVGRQVQPTLTIAQDALTYLEELVTQLLFLVCTSFPRTILDVEERVQKTFPQQINDWAIAFAKTTIEKGKKKKGLTLPLDKIHPFLCKVRQSSVITFDS